MNWYCVHTKPQKEEQVAYYCRDTLHLETFYPRLRQYRTVRSSRRIVTGPLFPRYLFCRFDPAVSYRAVRYAPETVDLVHFGGALAVLKDSLISELKQWAGDAVDVITIRPDLRPGDSVEIIDGPLRGLPAVILYTNDERDRVAILLSLLQCGAQMTISRSKLRRVSY